MPTSRTHRDLPSFPTRRSSDLSKRPLPVLWARTRIGAIELTISATRQRRTKRISPGRSEEHTSELQSLRHLVCRLLLEKKKKSINKKADKDMETKNKAVILKML